MIDINNRVGGLALAAAMLLLLLSLLLLLCNNPAATEPPNKRQKLGEPTTEPAIQSQTSTFEPSTNNPNELNEAASAQSEASANELNEATSAQSEASANGLNEADDQENDYSTPIIIPIDATAPIIIEEDAANNENDDIITLRQAYAEQIQNIVPVSYNLQTCSFPNPDYPDPNDETTTELLWGIVIYCWIRVSDIIQITITTVVDDHILITWHLSLAMQVRVIRLWLLLFGRAIYGPQPILVVWIVSVGSVIIRNIPEILSLLIDANNLGDSNFLRPLLHIAFGSRLHRNTDLFLLLNKHFRIFIHNGEHNHNNLLVDMDPYLHPILPVDMSEMTDDRRVRLLLGEYSNWAPSLGGQYQPPVNFPIAVSTAMSAAQRIYHVQIASNMGSSEALLASIPQGVIPQASIDRIALYLEHSCILVENGETPGGHLDYSFPGATGASDCFGNVVAKLTSMCRYYPQGCPWRGYTRCVGNHERICMFGASDRLLEIVDIQTAHNNTAIATFLTLPPNSNLPQPRSLFTSVGTPFYRFPPAFVRMCTPAGWTYCEGTGANFFRRVRTNHSSSSSSSSSVDENAPVPSHVVFTEVLRDPSSAQRAAFIERFAHYLLENVQIRGYFYTRR